MQATLDFAPASTSPFDGIRQLDGLGNEYWSARDLMPLMGYAKWQAFEVPLNRAITTANNQGHSAESNFTRSRKVGFVGKMAQEDFHLSRFAAYLVAMNGDPNKPEVAAAQAYFAIQTRVAETQAPQQLPAAPQSYADALRELAANVEALEAAEARARELEAPANAWQIMVDANGDYSVDEAAKILSRDETIVIGRNRLFNLMGQLGWLYRQGARNAWHAYQTQVEAGRLTVRMSAAFLNTKTKEMEVPAPTIRVTAKGIEALRAHLRPSTAVVAK